MQKNSDFKYESVFDQDSVVNYLKTITEGLKKGELVFKQGKDEIVLKPEGLINLEIKSKVKEGKSKLTIKLKWKKHSIKTSDHLLINSCI